MVQAGHDCTVSFYNNEEPELSGLCIPVKGLETNPQVTSRRSFRGKVQHTSSHSRNKKSAHDHQTSREKYCCQQGLPLHDEHELFPESMSRKRKKAQRCRLSRGFCLNKVPDNDRCTVQWYWKGFLTSSSTSRFLRKTLCFVRHGTRHTHV